MNSVWSLHVVQTNFSSQLHLIWRSSYQSAVSGAHQSFLIYKHSPKLDSSLNSVFWYCVFLKDKNSSFYHTPCDKRCSIWDSSWRPKQKSVMSEMILPPVTKFDNLWVMFHDVNPHRKKFFAQLSEKWKSKCFHFISGNLEPFDYDGWRGSELITPVGARLVLTHTHTHSYVAHLHTLTVFLQIGEEEDRAPFPRQVTVTVSRFTENRPWHCALKMCVKKSWEGSRLNVLGSRCLSRTIVTEIGDNNSPSCRRFRLHIYEQSLKTVKMQQWINNAIMY